MTSQDKRLGCLLLHGFTSSLDTVNGLVPRLERNGIPYRMPVLRGHCTRPEDMVGVTWHDWYADAEKALLDLSPEVQTSVVVGLSMGGLVALQLGMEHADKLAGVVTVAAALRFADPLAPLTPLLAKLFKFWPIDPANACTDKEVAKKSTNYRRFATDSSASLLEYARLIERRLPELRLPILIIETHQDKVIKPESAQIIHDRVSSAEKRLVWFEKSGHEMMQDLEREAVFDTIEKFLLAKRESGNQAPAES
jgi:carboxylesterase